MFIAVQNAVMHIVFQPIMFAGWNLLNIKEMG